MTIDELTEKTKNLEEELQYRIEDSEGLNRPARVTEVRVLEPYHDSPAPPSSAVRIGDVPQPINTFLYERQQEID